MQLYSSNKTERFSYKGGCGIYERMRIEIFKRRAEWAIDKRLWLITVIYYMTNVMSKSNRLKFKNLVEMFVKLC